MSHLVHDQIAAVGGETVQDATQRLKVSRGSPILVLLGFKAERHGILHLDVVESGGGPILVVMPHGVPQVVTLRLGILACVEEVSLLLIDCAYGQLHEERPTVKPIAYISVDLTLSFKIILFRGTQLKIHVS